MPTVRVVVYDSAIEAMSLPGGQVYKWTRQRAQRIRTLAIKKAPKRTGLLRESIHSRYEKPANGTIFYVGSDVYYAKWVHEGHPGSPGFHRLEGKPGQASHGIWKPGYQHNLYRGKWPRGTPHGVIGTDPDPYLSSALEEVLAALG